MTLGELLNQVDALKRNDYPAAQKIAWLSDVELFIKREIIDTHETDADERADSEAFSGYTEDTPHDTALLVPAPYCELYRFALEKQIDLANGEMNKYNNSVTLFNNAYATFAAWYNRTHMPIKRTTHFKL